MLKFAFLIIGFLLLNILPALAIETTYSSVMDDLPLMLGMTEQPEDTLIFDKPSGRIVEFSVRTPANAAAVQKFYGEDLPPLGWKVQSPAKFTRDDETLKLDFEKAGRETIVHFTLTPAKEGK